MVNYVRKNKVGIPNKNSFANKNKDNDSSNLIRNINVNYN
jgi:hypothetical protein